MKLLNNNHLNKVGTKTETISVLLLVVSLNRYPPVGSIETRLTFLTEDVKQNNKIFQTIFHCAFVKLINTPENYKGKNPRSTVPNKIENYPWRAGAGIWEEVKLKSPWEVFGFDITIFNQLLLPSSP